MSKAETIVSRVEDIPSEAHEALKKKCLEDWNMSEDEYKSLVEDVYGIIDSIVESGDYDKRIDYSYIYRDYYMTCGDWMFEVTGSSYLKDQCICEEELEDVITVTNLKLREEEKAARKAAKAAKAVKK